jgi:hypothetical protein
VDALDQVIEQRLSDISTQEIAGAYRSLCGMMLVQTVVAFRKGKILRQDDADAKRYASRWISTACGTLTFREVCEVLNLDIDRTRSALESVQPKQRSVP